MTPSKGIFGDLQRLGINPGHFESPGKGVFVNGFYIFFYSWDDHHQQKKTPHRHLGPKMFGSLVNQAFF